MHVRGSLRTGRNCPGFARARWCVAGIVFVANGAAEPWAGAQTKEPRLAPGGSPGDAAPGVAPASAPASETHTIFQVGLGLVSLPGAEICPSTPDNCEPGDTSIALRLHNLFRFDAFGLGAGIVWAFGLRSSAAAGDETGLLGREHSRGYFLFEGQFRYYLPRAGTWEWWVGTNIGAVVISDSWSVLADREPYADTAFIGPRAMTLATEGLVLGLGAGMQWRFAGDWIFAPHFHYANWILPQDRETTPLGDSASLAGRIDVFDFGLAVAYRVPL